MKKTLSRDAVENGKQTECQGNLCAGPRCMQLWLLETENYFVQIINKNSTKEEEMKQQLTWEKI